MLHIYKRTLAAIAMICMAIVPSVAQDHILLTARNLPQSMLINPSMRPDRSFVSIPIIGGFSVGANNSFSYKDVISTNAAGEKYVNSSNLLKYINGKDLLMLRLNLDIINTGFFVSENGYMGVSLRVRTHVAGSLPGGLLGAVLDNPINEYKSFDISTKPNAIGWAELGVSYSHQINESWQVGARLKYLNGIASMQSNGMDVVLDKQYDRYRLSGDYSLRGGGIDFAKNRSQLTIGSNPGVSADIGATYTAPDKRWYVLAGVSDLGAIFWNAQHSSVIQTHSGGKAYDYYGMDNLKGLLNGSTSITHLLDSAYKGFSKVLNADTTKVGFTQMLPTSFHAAGSYAIDSYRRHNVSASFVGMLPYHGKMHTQASVGYSYRTVTGTWQFMTNYTYKSNNPINIGLGSVMTTGIFQLYLSADNIISAFSLASARGASFNMGLNFFINKRAPKRDAKYYR